MGKASSYRIGIIEFLVDSEKIGTIAGNLTQGTGTWDECNWLLAEAELRLFPAYAPQPKEPRIGGLPPRVQLIPARILPHPEEDRIRPLAWDISQRQFSVQDLHWFIAQRYFLYDAVKAAHQK